MTQVLAQAIVDPIQRSFGDTRPGKRWSVTVTGYLRGEDPKTAQQRIYEICAVSDNVAAEEGLARFVAEFEDGTAS